MEGIAQKEKPMVTNAANSKQVHQAEDKQKRIRDQELNDIRSLLAMPQGKAFIWKYLGMCGIFRTSWDGSSNIYYKEGQRSIGLALLADVTDAAPEAFIQMMKDNKREK